MLRILRDVMILNKEDTDLRTLNFLERDIEKVEDEGVGKSCHKIFHNFFVSRNSSSRFHKDDFFPLQDEYNNAFSWDYVLRSHEPLYAIICPQDVEGYEGLEEKKY